MSPLHFQGEFTKINTWLQLIKHQSKRLQTTQAQKQEVSYAQAQTQETSNQTKLHIKYLRFEHLIYNQ